MFVSSPRGVLTTALFLFTAVNGHGRLTVPLTRKPTGYENDPVSGYTGSDFVCRNAVTTPATTLTAGSAMTLHWSFGAAHVGDCAVYISYDFDAAHADMQFFKIANLFDCKAQNNQDVTITLPDWLPGGRAVLRWDWYAIHQYPSVEFYSQCADITITPSASAVNVNTIPKYSIISPAVYPANGNTGVGFRDPFNANQGYAWQGGAQFMTGPACALSYAGNDCDLTAPGTLGYVDVGGNAPAPPTPAPVAGGPSQTPAPVASPVESPTSPPAAKPTAPPASGSCVTHTVVSGDSLYTIAEAHTAAGRSVAWSEICSANLLSNCGSLAVGDVLLIPCEGCGTIVQERQVRQVLGVAHGDVEVAVTTRCARNAAASTMQGVEFTGSSGETEPAEDGESNTSVVLLLVVIGLVTMATLGATVFLLIRERKSRQELDSKFRLLRPGKERSNSGSSFTDLPNAPTVAKGIARQPTDTAWKI